MDTVRVDICYRPLRIGWAIRAGDIDAFRRAVRLSYAFWGGRFNPILVVDREEEAKRLVDLFRVDLIWPVGEAEDVKAFPKKFPYLIKPFFHNSLFVDGMNDSKHAQILDIHNMVAHLIDTPEWKSIKERGLRLYNWQAADPLTDVFLVQMGDYPSADVTGIDYRAMVMKAAEATEHALGPSEVIPAEILEHLTIAYLSRHGLEQHYSVNSGRDKPGFFVGSASDIEDLVCHWNLRAADIPLWFIDEGHLARYANVIPTWERLVHRMVSHRHEWDRHVAVWSRRRDIETRRLFGDGQVILCHASDVSWNGLNVRAPMMFLGQASVLGVMGDEKGNPKVSFALSEKPFSGDISFHQQHLVASVSFGGGLYGDEQHTLTPPYLPELNEFCARTMHFHYDRLRIEPGRVGLVIDAADHDSFLYALPIADLMERIFGMAGYTSKLRAGGLILRQLIARLGDLQGARVFKIPGVRRLLRTYGPTAAFTKRNALQLIGSKDPENPTAKFSDYEDLYIEQRKGGGKLKPDAVFAYLIDKGLFRIGMELTCPSCRMASWTALDALKQLVVCELCGREYDATRQLVNGEWHYRRSGVLGAERNALGAVPVALTLQQLGANLDHGLHQDIYSPSLNLEPKEGFDLPKCEVDFVWVIPRQHSRKTAVILGECKDQGPIRPEDFEKDVENLRRVADALPRSRFKTFVLLSKLAPFTPWEIERVRILNDEYRQRAILLTARELEPYVIYERTKTEFSIDEYASTPEALAQATARMYFQERLPG